MDFCQIKSNINYSNLSFKQYKYICRVNKIIFRNYQHTICHWKLSGASVHFCYLKNHPKIRVRKKCMEVKFIFMSSRVNIFSSKTTRPRDMLFFLKDTLSIEDEKLFKACKSVCSSVC